MNAGIPGILPVRSKSLQTSASENLERQRSLTTDVCIVQSHPENLYVVQEARRLARGHARLCASVAVLRQTPATPHSTSAGVVASSGHNGMWFERATSGQGIAIEANFGGLASMAWATYDTVIGGPERQRWYTPFSRFAPGPDGAPLPLDIYQNTGGKFSAPPITASQKVGSATLRFTSCDQGTLDYATHAQRDVLHDGCRRPPTTTSDSQAAGTKAAQSP